MLNNEKNPFENHEIVSRVSSERLGSWLLKQKYKEGNGYDCNLWARITAADGLLTITGDFDPTTFAFGPVDPIQCILWMGKKKKVCSWVMQKACIGSGKESVYEYDTNLALKEVKELLKEELEKEEDERNDLFVEALQAGLDSYVECDGIVGCYLIAREILDIDPEAWEMIESLGEIPDQKVNFAIQALNRLVEILETEVR